ncbi:MAG: efflux RND transporter permease subunit [Gemmatimonadota bacterium]
MALPDLSIRRPVATWMFYMAVGVLGVVSFLRLPIDLLPDVAFPTLSVWTTYTDAGPEEVERFVTEPIEEQLSRVPGIRKVTSRSREGQSLVQLQFHWGTDMEFAALHTRERLDNLRESLPRSSERPVILRSDPTSDPILTLAVSGPNLRTMRDLAEAVFKRRLEQLDGVALAAVTGGPERELQVVVDPDRLEVHGVTIGAIARALDAANYNAPGGRIRRGRFTYSLRTLGQFSDVDQIRDVVVATPSGGSPVLLRDVATVQDTVAELETVARYNGVPAIGLQVYKEAGSNTVRVAQRVDRTVKQLREEFPEVRIELASSQATFIRDAISNVVQALLLGGALAFLVLFLFLRDPRYPLAIGLAIPVSVLAAFALCYLFDVSLNIMSLGGLALGVGLLVDNSIVVLENVFRHRTEEGRDAIASATVGAREVTGAITASTLTTIAVFGPVLYVRGVAGALFGDLSLAVTFSLLASLLVALTLLPILAARVAASGRAAPRGLPTLPGGRRTPWPVGSGEGGEAGGRSRVGAMWRIVRRAARAVQVRVAAWSRYTAASVWLTGRDVVQATDRALQGAFTPVLDAFDRGFGRFAGRYEQGLEWALAHRRSVILMAALGLASAVALGLRLPRSLMPRVDENEFRVDLELPIGTPLPTTSETVRKLEATLLRLEGVSGVFARVGRARGSELIARELTGLNSAAMEVRLAPDAPPTSEIVVRFRASLRQAGVDPAFVVVETGRATSLGRALSLGEADLAVKVQGGKLEQILPFAEAARRRMDSLPSLSDVRVDFQRTQPVLEIRIDRDAVARHGLTVRQVADAIENYLRGSLTQRQYAEFADKVEIRVTLPRSQRERLADVLRLRLRGVPLGQLVKARQGYGPVEIRHENQNRTVQVLADVRQGGLGRAVAAVQASLASLSRPPLVAVKVGGENEEMRESFRSLLFAFGLALALVYLIMAAQFESLVQPLVVLAAVPLAVIGAVPALWLAGDGINVMSGIGLVILIGIVVNDAIIKVDFINQQRAAGVAKRRAILEAGRLRLRPIIMTTVTTVAGLLPLALGWGPGADLRAPLAVVVIGGLVSATFLTLIVIPVVYSLAVEPGVAVRSRAEVGRTTPRSGSATRGVAT